MFKIKYEINGKVKTIESGILSEDEAEMKKEEYQIQYPDFCFFVTGSY